MPQIARSIAKNISDSYHVGRWLRGYIKGKLAGDPVFAAGEAVARTIPGPIVDLGCGLGLFGMWLRARGIHNSYSGCDLSGWKILSGNETARRLNYDNFHLAEGSMTDFPLHDAQLICAFDVLHYLPYAEQTLFLNRLVAATQNGATLLIRTGVKGCGWRSHLTSLEELCVRGSGWIRGGKINFPYLNQLIAVFTSVGCRVEACPLWGKTPFSSHWLQVSAPHGIQELP